MSENITENQTPTAPSTEQTSPSKEDKAKEERAKARAKKNQRLNSEARNLSETLVKEAGGSDINATISAEELQLLHKLISAPEDATLMDLFGDEEGLVVSLPDGTTLRDYQQALSKNPAKFSAPGVRSAIKRTKAILDNAAKVRESIEKTKKQLKKRAEISIRKERGGKQFLEIEELTGYARALETFVNPLEINNRVVKRNDTKGKSVYLYLAGSAIAPVSNDDTDSSVRELTLRVAEHTAELAVATGVNENSINRRVVPVPAAYTEDRVAVMVEYAIKLGSVNQLRLTIEALEAFGTLETLEKTLCSPALMEFNVSYGMTDMEEAEDPEEGEEDTEEQESGHNQRHDQEQDSRTVPGISEITAAI